MCDFNRIVIVSFLHVVTLLQSAVCYDNNAVRPSVRLSVSYTRRLFEMAKRIIKRYSQTSSPTSHSTRGAMLYPQSTIQQKLAQLKCHWLRSRDQHIENLKCTGVANGCQ